MRYYNLVARMVYGNRRLYFIMRYLLSWPSIDFIFVSFDPQLFLKSVINHHHNPHAIWESMVEDGLDVEEPSPFDMLPLRLWNSVPHSVFTLKLLSHVAIYKEKEKLQDIASATLPRTLKASVEDFLKARETREHYEFVVER